MKLVHPTKNSKAITNFLTREWDIVNRKYFGSEFVWVEKEGTILAKDNNKIVGYLHYIFHGGVMEISAIIVDSKSQRKGIGTTLMKELEKIAQKERAHKMYLITSFGERAIKFYESLGFKKSGVIKNHFRKMDMTEMSKQLKS